jgi:hypothetical protein
MNQLQALGVLRIFLDANRSTMKDSRINLIPDLFLEPPLHREEDPLNPCR